MPAAVLVQGALGAFLLKASLCPAGVRRVVGTIDQRELRFSEPLALNGQGYMLTAALYPEERCSLTEPLP